MVEEAEILKKLVVEEKDMIKELEKLVEDASGIFRIEKPSGRIIFQDFGTLNDKQRILVLLIGKYFATKIGIIKDPSLSISQIAKELGRPMTALSGPVRDLVKQGFVENIPGRKYKITYHRIKDIFSKILLSKDKGNWNER
ncbi:MAG: MarR family transcriptional regulator [Candidatus Parvarchaeota archaeon]|nr:MarR family transcriptional regulator [Candidatus Jingweiarchaeum tengchongense]MCW1304569.1 MarR family transcriptional regulator [Candidatus Jingweiarchaeum tengchongense]MCW1310241.1 MarR family transcriptional regulator [Candidatus Jingweiarchaeum tengchongense]